MSETKWTKGPWKYRSKAIHFSVYEALENMTSLVETLLLHFGAGMSQEDLAGRSATFVSAQAALRQARGK